MKLVRDKIPAIIRSIGVTPVTRTARADEYRQLLMDKLTEEAGEVRSAPDAFIPGELADVLEVVYAIGADLGVDEDHLEKMRADKFADRGGFSDRTVWLGNLEAGG